MVGILIYLLPRPGGEKIDLAVFECKICTLEGAPEAPAASEMYQNLGMDPGYGIAPTVVLAGTTSALPNRCR